MAAPVELPTPAKATRKRATVRPATSVLYDAPGPRTKRILWVSSAAAAALLLVLGWYLVIRPLDEQGQFSEQLWGPIIDPDNASFTPLWQLIGRGTVATLKAAAIAVVTSLICGLALAMLRIQLKHLTTQRFSHLPQPVATGARGLTWLLNGVTRVCVELLRGMPVLVTIFFVARGLRQAGLHWPEMWFLVIGLTLYNMVVIAEIVRSGIEGLPRGQREAAASIGLSPAQTTRLVLLPQAVRVMLPAVISQLVVVLKDTSLGVLIGYHDLLWWTKTAVLNLNNPIQMYIVVGLIFLVVNYALSRLATWTQRHL
jgi:glutamate transport system permease protein